MLLEKPEVFQRVHRIRQAYGKLDPLFLLFVVLPTFAATIYYGFLASDVYISESRFVVRSPDKPSKVGLGAILETAGFSSTGSEIYAAHDYVESRDALRALNKRDSVVHAYHNPNIFLFDRFNPLGFSGSFEDLFNYYKGKIGVEYSTTTSIMTLQVRAFTPEDAQRLNRQLLEASEALVNRLNERGRGDLIRFAAQEVREAEQSARVAASSLARFRNARGVIDPERQATVQLQMVSKLQDELIGARTQLAQLRSMAPENPQIPVLQVRINELSHEINQQSGMVAGSSRSLSANAAEYQRLQLESQIADRRLTGAMNSLQEASDEARRKQAYVERIVEPSLADDAQEPRRLRSILATLVLGLVGWAIARMLLAGIREHHG